MRKSCYIVGPMRGWPNLNYDAFALAAKFGRSGGWMIISPHEMDAEHGIFPDTWLNTHDQIRSCVHRDVQALLSLRAENGDAIALLPGWERSIGARAELAIANWLRLEVLDAITFMPSEAAMAEVPHE